MSELNNYLQYDNNNETILEIPVKKKKGRKSKQVKMLELEEIEKNKVPIKLFPTLSEKIFDVIKIGDNEYYLDTDFEIIYNSEIKQIGIKKNDKYMLYSETDIDKLYKQVELDNNEITKIIKLYTNN